MSVITFFLVLFSLKSSWYTEQVSVTGKVGLDMQTLTFGTLEIQKPEKMEMIVDVATTPFIKPVHVF